MICRTCEEIQEFNPFGKCEDCVSPYNREPEEYDDSER